MLKKLLQRLKDWSDFQPQSGSLRRQYQRALEARLHQFERRKTPGEEPTVERIRHLLSSGAGWEGAYAADLLVPQLLTGPEIDIEFESRLEEARVEWPSTTADLRNSYAERWKALSDETRKRALLQDLVHQSLWQFAVVDQERTYRSKAILWSAVLFILSLVSLFTAFKGLDSQRLDLSSWSGTWWMVALAGWAGASFSWLTRMRDTVQETKLEVLKDISRWHYSMSRAFIGVGAAMVLYWALSGGFVSGAVFPVLDATQSEARVTRLTQAFKALASAASQCSPSDAQSREALLASAVDNFRALLLVHVRERRTAGESVAPRAASNRWLDGLVGTRPDYLDLTDRDWLLRAGLRLPAKEAGEPQRALTLCSDLAASKGAADPGIRDALASGSTIRNALLTPPGTLALLLFWSFAAGFSEKLVPSILDRAGEKAKNG